MRLHKFETPNAGPVWIDLDQVTAVRGFIDRTEIIIGGWTHLTIMPLEDVLALISPPAAPDTFEQQLRDQTRDFVVEQEQRAAIFAAMRKKADEWAVRDAQTEEAPQPVDISEALKQGERRCRLDELKRMQSAVNNAMYGYLHGADLERRFNAIVEARRAVLEA